MFIEDRQIRAKIRELIAHAIHFEMPFSEMADRIEEKIEFHPGPNTPPGAAQRDLRAIIEEEVNRVRFATPDDEFFADCLPSLSQADTRSPRKPATGHAMRDHPIVGMIPPLLFLVMLVFTGQLVRDPFVSYLPIAGGLFFIIGLVLMWGVRSRLERTRKHHDAETDTREVYFNQNVSVAEKFMLMQQRTGCFTVVACLGYFLLALVCVGFWVIGKYFVSD